MARAALAVPTFATLTACAAVAALAPLENLPRDASAPADCALEVRFGSICCGPDVALEERVRKAALADPRVVKAYGWSWGEEGETSLCLVLRNRASARLLAAEYKSWVAARPQPMLTSVELK